MAQAIPDVQNKNPAKHDQPAGHRMSRSDDNVVFIGKKPTMSYVLAVMTQAQGGASEIHIKARGKNISRAVDVAEVVKNRFMQNVSKHIETGTEVIEDMDRNKINVSTIDIKLVR